MCLTSRPKDRSDKEPCLLLSFLIKSIASINCDQEFQSPNGRGACQLAGTTSRVSCICMTTDCRAALAAVVTRRLLGTVKSTPRFSIFSPLCHRLSRSRMDARYRLIPARQSTSAQVIPLDSRTPNFLFADKTQLRKRLNYPLAYLLTIQKTKKQNSPTICLIPST